MSLQEPNAHHPEHVQSQPIAGRYGRDAPRAAIEGEAREHYVGVHRPLGLGDVALELARRTQDPELMLTARHLADRRGHEAERDTRTFIAALDNPNPVSPALFNGGGFEDPAATHLINAANPHPLPTPRPPEPAHFGGLDTQVIHRAQPTARDRFIPRQRSS